jgi:hypothetical protein
MRSFPDEVKTDAFTIRLTAELGTGGGQGRIFRTPSPQLIVKLLNDRSLERRHSLKAQLNRLRWIGGEDDLARLHLTRPGGVLQEPHLGYTMELLTGMVPLQDLLASPDDPEGAGTWYVHTGGLGRRLRLLARAAEILHGLHGRSLVYADPSPNNIFVSEDVQAEEVWLIDVDNLHFESETARRIFTPRYGAPEVVAERNGVNTLTDAHAFAVIAFEVLTLCHPLIGDTVNESAPEVEERALRGEWGYIEHSTEIDSRFRSSFPGGEEDIQLLQAPPPKDNRCSTGVPRAWALCPPLRELARQCFQLGLNHPRKRPGLSSWVKELHAAADTVLTCPAPGCRWGYNVHHDRCPACQHPRPEFYLARVFRCPVRQGNDPELLGAPTHQLVAAAGSPARLTSRVVDLRVGPESHEDRLVLLVRDRQVRVKPRDGGDYWLVSSDGVHQQRIDREQPVPPAAGEAGTSSVERAPPAGEAGTSSVERAPPADGQGWLIHLGPPDRAHQVVRLAYFARGEP